MFHRSANLIITSSVMGCLAIAAVALRLWAKGIRRLKIGADDFLIVGGLILALALCVCNIVGAARFRFGDHELYIESGPLEGYPVAWLLLGYGKIFYAIQLLHATAMPVIKASLMFFLNRIFGHVRVFRVALWTVGGYVFLWWLATFWMSVFQCWPISSNWGTTPEQNGNCIPNYMTWYSWAALLNVLSDVALVTIPIPLVWRLQMPMRRRLASVSILTTAIIVIIAGIGRTVGYFTYNHDSLDFSYVFYDFLIWTSIEPCLGVVGCCLPTLGPLVDLKNSAIYVKIKSTFSRQSLLHRSVSGASRGESERRAAWIELMNETNHSQPKSIEEHRAIINGKYLDDVLPATHQHRLAAEHLV